MVCASVRSIIPELKLWDYLSVQAHKPRLSLIYNPATWRPRIVDFGVIGRVAVQEGEACGALPLHFHVFFIN